MVKEEGLIENKLDKESLEHFINLMKRNSLVGVCANRSQAKTSLILHLLITLKKQNKNIKIAVLGVNEELEPTMNKYGIMFLRSTMDVLDLRLRNTIIFIDEMALLFDPQSKNKQLDKLMRFFDRIEHLNCKLICATAREGYFNKFMCSRLTGFIVKQVEFEALVRGTWLRERIKAIATNNSDYRLECDKNEYYIITTEDPAVQYTFPYNYEIDTKKDNIDLFDKTKPVYKSYPKDEPFNETKDDC